MNDGFTQVDGRKELDTLTWTICMYLQLPCSRSSNAVLLNLSGSMPHAQNYPNLYTL